jgi:hypothetical protein
MRGGLLTGLSPMHAIVGLCRIRIVRDRTNRYHAHYRVMKRNTPSPSSTSDVEHERPSRSFVYITHLTFDAKPSTHSSTSSPHPQSNPLSSPPHTSVNMQFTTLLTATLATAASASILPRAPAFSGKGQIRLFHETTHVDSGCLTSDAAFTTTESACGVFTGTLSDSGLSFQQADIQASTGGYLGHWARVNGNSPGNLTTTNPKPANAVGTERYLSLSFDYVKGGPYLGTGYINNYATWGANPPAKGQTSRLETSKSNTPAPSYVLGWKAL